ncbi:MAG: nuclear transport factor 2 family protein [Candidatus Eremiobacteraeota bacterium]|nr:nuclear transport factor 2 family protein [Candidatus Eremiobacteraeota bacterium]
MTIEQVIAAVIIAWRNSDAKRATSFFALDGVYHEAFGDAIVGREPIQAHFDNFFAKGPLWKFGLGEVLVQGNRAAVRYDYGQRGQASGIWKERAGCAFVAFNDEKQITLWREYQG